MKKTKLLAAFAIPSLSMLAMPLATITSCTTQDNIVINGNASYDKSTTKVTKKKASTVTLLADKGYIILGVESVSVEGKKLTTASYSYNPDTRQVSIKDYAMIGINVSIDVKTEAVVTKTAKLNWKDDSSISKYYYHFSIDKRQATVDTSNNVITFNISADPYWNPAAIVKGQWIVKNGITTVKKQDANLRAATQYITIDDWSKINDGDELTIVFERNADEKWAKVEYDNTFLASNVDTTSCVVSVASHFNYLQLNICANSDVDGTVSVVDTTTGKTVGTTDELTVDTYNKKHSIKLDWSNITDLGTLKVSFKEIAPTGQKLKIVCDWHELDDVNDTAGKSIKVTTDKGDIVSDATITVEPATVATVSGTRILPKAGGSATITVSKDGYTPATWEIEVATFAEVDYKYIEYEESEEEEEIHIVVPEEKNEEGEEANSDETSESGNVWVHSVKDTATGYNCAKGDIVIPSRFWDVDLINNTAGWKTVVGFYYDYDTDEGGFDNYKENEAITSITIPNTIKKIGWDCFNWNKRLEKVTFASNSELEIIQSSAFLNCEKLTEIAIPDSVTALGEDAFEYTGLKTINFGDDSKLKTIGYQCFAYCDALTSFTVPYGVINIFQRAFASCNSLKSVEFKNTGYWYNITSSDKPVTIGVDDKGKASNANYLRITDNIENPTYASPNWGYTGLYHIITEVQFNTALENLHPIFGDTSKKYTKEQIKSVIVNGTPITDFSIIYAGLSGTRTCTIEALTSSSETMDIGIAPANSVVRKLAELAPYSLGARFTINKDGSLEYTYDTTSSSKPMVHLKGSFFTHLVVNKWGYVTEWEWTSTEEQPEGTIFSFKIEFDGDPE